MPPTEAAKPAEGTLPRNRERLLLLALAAIQFTTVLDFLIILPLGPQYKRVFHIDPQQFGFIVSSYGISAGVAGLAAGFFLDRFDRRKALLLLYLGFVVGTLLCAVSPTYHTLVASRSVAGAFGGVVGAVILAIVGDVVPMARRGAAMGMVMSSFSVSSIVGVPLGLYLATHYNWHVPFYAIAAASLVILFLCARIAPPLRTHLLHVHEDHPVARTWAVMTHPDHQKAFMLMAALTATGFFVFPYISNYMVANVGLTEAQLPLIYLCGGSCTLFSMNLVGRWSDRAGKMRVFTITSLSAAVPIFIFTHLPQVPLAVALSVTTLLMICMSSRMVPAMAMMTAAVEARYRGGFMSINAAVQQFSMGLASLLSGMILGETTDGKMTHYAINGYISIVLAYLCIYLARFLKPPAGKQGPAEETVAVTEY